MKIKFLAAGMAVAVLLSFTVLAWAGPQGRTQESAGGFAQKPDPLDLTANTFGSVPGPGGSFSPTSAMISGQIKDENGVPVEGVEIRNVANQLVAVTLNNGTYSFDLTTQNNFNPFRAVKTGYVFSPAYRFYFSIPSQNLDDQNYTAGLPGEFVNTNTAITGLPQSDAAWGDYNNDGFLDFLISGHDSSSGSPRTLVYQNNGNGTFTKLVNTGLPGLMSPQIEWVDFDRDGFLDVYIQGGDYEVRLYKNLSGSGIFSLVSTGFPQASCPGHAWGDFDNDGYPDLLLSGYFITFPPGGGVSFDAGTRLYHGDPLGTFTEIPLSGIPTGMGIISAAAGDFDNDGLLDVALSGYMSGSTNWDATKICRTLGYNANGQLHFAVIKEVLFSGKMSWGDYDKDGDLDLALSGSPDSSYNPFQVKIYRNDGIANGQLTLTDINADLVQVADANIEWGDYDNDGDLDLLIYNGLEKWENYSPNGPWNPADAHAHFNEIYRNDGPGANGQWIFTNIIAGMYGQQQGSSRWGDFDNDGDLDVLVIGQKENFCGNTSTSALYSNESISGGGPQVNISPAVPGGLTSAVSGNNVTLSWQKAWDNQTPQNGLSYNIFLGTGSPYSVSRISPLAEVPSGFRHMARIGAQNENTSWALKGLPNGTYSWGVQAIDTAFAGSPFATGTFIIGPATYTISGTVTHNGQGLANVEIKEGSSVLAITNNSGFYIFAKSAGWSGIITPSRTGYNFNPSSRTYTQLNSNQANQNYAANLLIFTVSGTVYDPSGNGLAEVEIAVANLDPNLPEVQPTMTQADGSYALVNVPYGWDGKVKPAKAGYLFDPQMRLYADVSQDQTGQDYNSSLQKFTISGAVVLADGAGPLADVELKDDNGIVLATTGQDGLYAFEKEWGWSGVVKPVKSDYVFDPISREYNALNSDQEHQDYKARKIIPMITIAGYVFSAPNEMPVKGVVLAASGGILPSGQAYDPPPVTTNESGYYAVQVPMGWSGTITPSRAGYAFTPKKRKYTALQTQANLLSEYYRAAKALGGIGSW